MVSKSQWNYLFYDWKRYEWKHQGTSGRIQEKEQSGVLTGRVERYDSLEGMQGQSELQTVAFHASLSSKLHRITLCINI